MRANTLYKEKERLVQRPSFHGQYWRPGVKDKKDKALSTKDLNKSKNNVAVTYIPSGKKGGNSV